MSLVGGYSDKDSTDPTILSKDGKANRNTLTVTGTVGYALGGYARDAAGNAEANGNTLTVKGTVTNNAFGGYSNNGSATGNFVFIDGGTVDRALGGYAWDGNATGNTVTLISGKVTNNVRGGEGSNCSTYDCVGNTLAVQGKDFPVGYGVSNFDTLNFTLPADIKHNDTMLKVGKYAAFPESGSTDPTTVTIAMAAGAKLGVGDSVTLIEANTSLGTYKLEITPASTTVKTADGYEFELSVDTANNKLVATVVGNYSITHEAKPTEGGEVDCGATKVARGDNITCTAKAKPGYIYDDDSIRLESGAATVACSGASCSLTNFTSNVKVSATFTKAPDPTPYYSSGDNSSPTMGELGLLLSGLALAGAAAPALRRRERKERKQA